MSKYESLMMILKKTQIFRVSKGIAKLLNLSSLFYKSDGRIIIKSNLLIISSSKGLSLANLEGVTPLIMSCPIRESIPARFASLLFFIPSLARACSVFFNPGSARHEAVLALTSCLAIPPNRAGNQIPLASRACIFYFHAYSSELEPRSNKKPRHLWCWDLIIK